MSADHVGKILFILSFASAIFVFFLGLRTQKFTNSNIRKKEGFTGDKTAEVLERDAGDSTTNCSDYRSILQITWTRGSGLGDHSKRIESYGDLATWLCTTLIIPPPSMWLHKKHNSSIPLNEEITWSDYFKTVRLSDGESFLSTERFNKTNGEERAKSRNCNYLYANPTNIKEILQKVFVIRQPNECFWWDYEDPF